MVVEAEVEAMEVAARGGDVEEVPTMEEVPASPSVDPPAPAGRY